MNIKIKIKNLISKYNPFAIARRKRMQKQLNNKDITLLIPNCAGGHLFHDLRLQFKSPTINLMMYQDEFIIFCLNLDAYLSADLVFFNHEEYSFPCAKIIVDGLPTIHIHFNHYSSETEAEEKWNERKKRINKNNMFVFAEERDGITKDDILKLSQLRVKGLVVFTCNNYSDIPYQVYIPKYHADGEVGNILIRHYWNDSKEYEKYFDFVKWFNEASGYPYDVSDYIL